MYLYIKSIRPNQSIYYVLHEHKQHGLQDHINDILDEERNFDLIILPDSSSNDYEYHEQLAARGMKCLVLDHHEIDDDQPISSNACIINNQLSPDYPNKDLTGAGVAWQFCRLLDDRGWGGDSASLIDLAALGICGDMGSILDLENRYIMLEGFKNIQNYFFKCAVEKQSYSMNNEITPISVAFYIVPLMNALIRVGTMPEKERLFLALIDGHKLVPCLKRGAKGTLEEVAIESLRECTNAKAKQDRITNQMVEDLEVKIFKYDLLDNKVLFVRLEDEDDYPSEVVGLCSMKLAAKYKHPTIIARMNDEGFDRGSARGLNQSALVDFKQFLNDSGYFEYAQGHANAFGISIQNSNLSNFHQYANEQLKDMNFNEGVYGVNFIRESGAPDLENLIIDLANQSDVWGQDNPEPFIYIPNIYLTKNDYSIIGQKADTVRINLNGVTLIKFHATKMIEELQQYNSIKLNIVGKPNINTWMGQQTAQLFINDYEIEEDNILEF